jgi:hypothetical protein
VAINQLQYSQIYEKLVAGGMSDAKAQAQAAKEAETTGGAPAMKTPRSKLTELVLGKKAYGSSVPKEKRDAIESKVKGIEATTKTRLKKTYG